MYEKQHFPNTVHVQVLLVGLLVYLLLYYVLVSKDCDESLPDSVVEWNIASLVAVVDTVVRTVVNGPTVQTITLNIWAYVNNKPKPYFAIRCCTVPCVLLLCVAFSLRRCINQSINHLFA